LHFFIYNAQYIDHFNIIFVPLQWYVFQTGTIHRLSIFDRKIFCAVALEPRYFYYFWSIIALSKIIILLL